MSYNFFRIQMDIKQNTEGKYEGDIFQLCWKKPITDEQGIPKTPYIEVGIFDLNLSEYPEVKEALDQVLLLAIPPAVSTLSSPPKTEVTP